MCIITFERIKSIMTFMHYKFTNFPSCSNKVSKIIKLFPVRFLINAPDVCSDTKKILKRSDTHPRAIVSIQFITCIIHICLSFNYVGMFLSFFDQLSRYVGIFCHIIVDKKLTFLNFLPFSSCQCSL